MKRRREMTFLLPDYCPSPDLKRIKKRASARKAGIAYKASIKGKLMRARDGFTKFAEGRGLHSSLDIRRQIVKQSFMRSIFATAANVVTKMRKVIRRSK